jgi:hypothetical protein
VVKEEAVIGVDAGEIGDDKDDLNDTDPNRCHFGKMSSTVSGQIAPGTIDSTSRLTKFWQLFLKRR